MNDEKPWLTRLAPGPDWLPLAACCLREQHATQASFPEEAADPLLYSPEARDRLESALLERSLDCLERGRRGELDRLLAGLEDGDPPSRTWAASVRLLLAHPGEVLQHMATGTGAWAVCLKRSQEVLELVRNGRFRSAEGQARDLCAMLPAGARDGAVLPLCLRALALLLMGRVREGSGVLSEARARQSAEAPLEPLLEELAGAGRQAADQDRQRRTLLVESFRHGDMLGRSAGFVDLLARLRRAAAHDDPVLLCGESGTGKELAARYLHGHSPRRQAPLVSLNCAGLPLSLAESELFGSAAGAFTGARERPGLVERAHGGTLFLDEFGAMPPALQAKLLRLLESGEYYRVGDARPRFARFRLLAATNEEQRLTGSEFRQDLRFRLGGEPLRLPPLRERREDLPLLCQAFLLELPEGELAQDLCSPRSQALLAQHAWPGNIRELRYRLRDLVRLAPQQRNRALKELAERPALLPAGRVAEHRGLRSASDAAERSAVADALRRHPRDKRQAARELGISLPTLYARLKRWQDEDQATRLEPES